MKHLFVNFALHLGIPEKLTIDSLNILHKKLTKKLAAHYQDIGIQLGLEMCEIKALSLKDVDVTENFRKMLDKWINKCEERDGADILRRILQALESEAVNQVALANKLRKQWKDCYCKLPNFQTVFKDLFPCSCLTQSVYIANTKRQ